MSMKITSREKPAEVSTGLLKGSIRFLTIVLMVTAAAAPLVVVSTYIPLSLSDGGGFATPLTYVIATLILLVFTVGFAQMAKRVTAAGAYYNFTTRGLGKAVGLGAGWTITAAYSMISAAISGGLGYFASTAFQTYLHLNVPWWVCSIAGLALMFLLSYFKVTLAGKVLGIALAVEVLIVFIVATTIVVRGGAQGQMPELLNPAQLFTAPAIGLGLFFAFWSWIGFETTAIYGEEVTDPKRSVPKATYIAVITLGIFYSFVAYASVIGFGDKAPEKAGSLVGQYFFVLTDMYTFPALRVILDFLVITSFFVCSFAFHNNASRYIFSMGRDHILPAKFGHTHHVHKSPYVANAVQSTVAILVVALFALAGADPMLQLAGWLPIFCTAGVVFVQLLVSLAVISYFSRVGRSGIGEYWKTLIAPLIGALSQAVVLVLLVIYTPYLAGDDILAVNLLPYYALGIALAGVIFALYLRKKKPERYARIGTLHDEAEPEGDDATSTVTDKYKDNELSDVL
jgi:amino acid transporter